MVQAGLFIFTPDGTMAYPYLRPVFPSATMKGDKTFQRVASSEKEADVFPPTKAWLLSLESRKIKTA